MKIKNINDEFIDAEIIRYFNSDGNEYLIYSLSEADESGYIKLYASKIIDNQACIINDNDEWDLIKQLIKEIVRNNRDGNELNIIDLDEDNLFDIELKDTKIVFKLQGNLVTLLSENKNVLKHAAIVEEPEEIIEENLDYEILYNEQIGKNKELQDEIENLKKEIDNYKEKISKLKELLEEE